MDALERQKEAELEEKRRRTQELREKGQTQENKGTSKKKKQLQDREKERQRQAAVRAAEREDDEDEEDPSREGHRKFARGRAYDPERYGRDEGEEQPDMNLDADELDEELETLVLSEESEVYDDEVVDEPVEGWRKPWDISSDGEDDDYGDYDDEDEDDDR